ncbi:MAG: M23 family metallopeptidase [Treponema sp.]|jgi:murein DD-endopeptidase MepM/ murein hydrolase activator NlpD|nr:M23 family metallopeptidase [Treponema sp.]
MNPYSFCLTFFFVLVCHVLFPLNSGENREAVFPVISRLDNGDVLFRQYLADVEAARRRLFNRRDAENGDAASKGEIAVRDADRAESLAESLTIYAYTPKPGEDILSLAARCTLPYAALATLNRLPAAAAKLSGSLLLPSMPGLFIPEEPGTDLEMLLASAREAGTGILLTVRQGGKTEKFRFIPGQDFSPTERAFFLHLGFRFPLRDYRLTSSFGPRINPLTGNPRFHQGLDLAAPAGTKVFAARSGVVAAQGYDSIYGNYIIISHGDWTSLYGHLSEIYTVLLKTVQSGSLIGKVGSTGQSTGPHLHFELRQNGIARDPERYLYLFKEGGR